MSADDPKERAQAALVGAQRQVLNMVGAGYDRDECGEAMREIAEARVAVAAADRDGPVPPPVIPPDPDPDPDPDPGLPPTDSTFVGEDPIFQAGGQFPLDSSPIIELMDDPRFERWVPLTSLDGGGFAHWATPRSVWDELTSGGKFGATAAVPVPAELSNRVLCFNNDRKQSGDGVPYWGFARCYLVHGELRNSVAIRSGAWSQRKEGHSFYGDLYGGDMLFENFYSIQAGGQHLQTILRGYSCNVVAPNGEQRPPRNSGESDKAWDARLRKSSWFKSLVADNNTRLLRVIGGGCEDCGYLDRASVPLSFFNSGHRVMVQGVTVRQGLSDFVETLPGSLAMGSYRSRGAVGCIDNAGLRCPSFTIEGGHFECVRSNRAEIRFSACDDAVIRDAVVLGTRYNGLPVVRADTDCTQVRIQSCKTDVYALVYDRASGKSLSHTRVPAGTDWSLR